MSDEYSFRTDPKQSAGSDDQVTFGSEAGWNLAASQNVRVEDGSIVPSTVPSTVIDSYEDGDLSEYGGGDPGLFGTPSGSPPDGSRWLRWESGSLSNEGVWSGSGLSEYPGQGDRFAIFAKNDRPTDSFQLFWFGVQNADSVASADNPDDGYDVIMRSRGDDLLQVRKQSGGGVTLLAETTVDWSQYAGEWLGWEFEWASDGTITETVYTTDAEFGRDAEGAAVSATDTEFSSGGIGIESGARNDAAGQLHWDAWRL